MGLRYQGAIAILKIYYVTGSWERPNRSRTYGSVTQLGTGWAQCDSSGFGCTTAGLESDPC